MNITTVRRNIKDFGLLRAAGDIGLRAANRVMVLRIFEALYIDTVDPAFLEVEETYRGLFMDEALLREFSADPVNELNAAFIAAALAKGDECYGFLAGNELAAFGWYSTKPTDTDLGDLQQHFCDQYVYMYHGFTAPKHRGHRLHPIGMTRALAEYLRRGYRGIVSCVDWNNFNSLKACSRMGYQRFGYFVVAGVDDHYVAYHNAGCERFQYKLKHKLAPRQTRGHPTAARAATARFSRR